MTNGTRLAQQWTALWNGDYDLAEKILTPDFQVLFASDAASVAALRGPEGFLSFLRPWRDSRPGLLFVIEGTPLEDTNTERTAVRWHVSHDALPEGKGGLDQLDCADGRITRVWSVTGTRGFGGHGRLSG